MTEEEIRADERERIIARLDTQIPVTWDGYASIEEIVEMIRHGPLP